jgi:hypothetical protein
MRALLAAFLGCALASALAPIEAEALTFRDESIGRLLDDGEGRSEDADHRKREVPPDDAG